MEYWDSVQDTPCGHVADMENVHSIFPIFLTYILYTAFCPGLTVISVLSDDICTSQYGGFLTINVAEAVLES